MVIWFVGYLVKKTEVRIQESVARILNSVWNELKDAESLFPLSFGGEGWGEGETNAIRDTELLYAKRYTLRANYSRNYSPHLYAISSTLFPLFNAFLTDSS